MNFCKNMEVNSKEKNYIVNFDYLLHNSINSHNEYFVKEDIHKKRKYDKRISFSEII